MEVAAVHANPRNLQASQIPKTSNDHMKRDEASPTDIAIVKIEIVIKRLAVTLTQKIIIH